MGDDVASMRPVRRQDVAAGPLGGEHMTDMVERLTLAIQTRANDGADSPVDYGDAEYLARAVLEALREPSGEMMVAGWKKADERDAILGNGEIVMLWQAMIDAALK